MIASVAVAIATSGLALWLAGGRGGRPPLFLSATALGCAIAGMHYTAMAGLTLMPFPAAATPEAPALSTDLLAIVVAIVAFVVSGIFLLTLVPDRSRGVASSDLDDEPAEAYRAAGNAATLGQGTYQPLGVAWLAAAAAQPQQLPVEREGATHYVPVDDIVAVHANAHYTYLYDGQAKLFCPLAIGDRRSRGWTATVSSASIAAISSTSTASSA